MNIYKKLYCVIMFFRKRGGEQLSFGELLSVCVKPARLHLEFAKNGK